MLLHKLGFMQGRLSPLQDGKIQSFPWKHWESEFSLAHLNNWSLMEWTLDYERLHENPLLTSVGRKRIQQLCEECGLAIISLTGDCFMQAPFYKVEFNKRSRLLDDLKRILEACAEINIQLILIPLVDNGRLENESQEAILFDSLMKINPYLKSSHQKIIFESDFDPLKLSYFIKSYDSKLYGLNYDIGNSASLGYDPKQEIKMYGDRILNVHIKDRVLGGGTVPLGEGDAKIAVVLNELAQRDYQGNFILQAARASDENHVAQLNRYRDFLVNIMARN